MASWSVLLPGLLRSVKRAADINDIIDLSRLSERRMPLTILFSLAFILLGAFFLYRSISARLMTKKAQDWPIVQGKVLASEVVEDRFRNPTGKATIAFVPQVSYQYNVNGVSYTSSRIAFGSTNYDYMIAARICEKFAVDTSPNVYYDPTNPAESVLAPKSTEGLRSIIPSIFFIFTGFIILLFGILFQGK